MGFRFGLFDSCEVWKSEIFFNWISRWSILRELRVVKHMTMATFLSSKSPRGRGPADGRAFFERLWRGNFFLDRQRVFKRSRKRKLQTGNNGKKKQQGTGHIATRQHCCCCQRIQLHLLAGRRNSVRSVVRWILLSTIRDSFLFFYNLVLNLNWAIIQYLFLFSFLEKI